MTQICRSDIIPALLRPAMYTGEKGDRSDNEWLADAVAEVLNWKLYQESKREAE